MGARERCRGARGEREAVKVVQVAGWPNAKRTSDGTTQAGRGDIGNGPEGVLLSVKYRERTDVWAWMAEAQRDAGDTLIPIVAFRRNRSGWLAVIELDELLALIKHREQA